MKPILFFLVMAMLALLAAGWDNGSHHNDHNRDGDQNLGCSGFGCREFDTSRIHLSLDQIPVVQPLPLWRLGAAVLAPHTLLHDIIHSIAPGSRLGRQGRGREWTAHDGHRLVASVDPQTGESNVFPDLDALKPGLGLKNFSKLIASQAIDKFSLFPADGTDIILSKPMALFGSRQFRGHKPTEPQEYLSYVQILRQIGGLLVNGPGSRAMIAVAADKSIKAFTHRWQQASATNKTVKPFPPKDILNAIRHDICNFNEALCSPRLGRRYAPHEDHGPEVTVKEVKVVYYDGGRKFLQPVYRFRATVSSMTVSAGADHYHLMGYVPIGEKVEPLPSLSGEKSRTPPRESYDHHDYDEVDKLKHGRSPTVGRYYYNFKDDSRFKESTDTFLTGLLKGPGRFVSKQNLEASPKMFTRDKDSYVNSVNIAAMEVHGDWNEFWTAGTPGNNVHISDIPSSGYGPGSGGSLAYWFIHACMVIPTQVDKKDSFDVWWPVFNGLHAVVGARTDMEFLDGSYKRIGTNLAKGASVVVSWLHEISTNSFYVKPDGSWRSQDGRASAILVCNHTSDTAFDYQNLGRPDCLQEWWFND